MLLAAQESRPGGAAAASGSGAGAAPAAATGAGPGPAPGSGLGSGQEPPRQGQPPARATASDKKYIANMLGAVSALQEHEKCAPCVARMSRSR